MTTVVQGKVEVTDDESASTVCDKILQPKAYTK